jgi:hypothetical protein
VVLVQVRAALVVAVVVEVQVRVAIIMLKLRELSTRAQVVVEVVDLTIIQEA